MKAIRAAGRPMARCRIRVAPHNRCPERGEPVRERGQRHRIGCATAALARREARSAPAVSGPARKAAYSFPMASNPPAASERSCRRPRCRPPPIPDDADKPCGDRERVAPLQHPAVPHRCVDARGAHRVHGRGAWVRCDIKCDAAGLSTRSRPSRDAGDGRPNAEKATTGRSASSCAGWGWYSDGEHKRPPNAGSAALHRDRACRR